MLLYFALSYSCGIVISYYLRIIFVFMFFSLIISLFSILPPLPVLLSVSCFIFIFIFSLFIHFIHLCSLLFPHFILPLILLQYFSSLPPSRSQEPLPRSPRQVTCQDYPLSTHTHTYTHAYTYIHILLIFHYFAFHVWFLVRHTFNHSFIHSFIFLVSIVLLTVCFLIILFLFFFAAKGTMVC